MKKKTLILAVLVIGLLLPSCSNNSNDMMSSVIEKGLKRSIEQSEFMAASLMDQPDRLPKTTERWNSCYVRYALVVQWFFFRNFMDAL